MMPRREPPRNLPDQVIRDSLKNRSNLREFLRAAIPELSCPPPPIRNILTHLMIYFIYIKSNSRARIAGFFSFFSRKRKPICEFMMKI